MKNNIKKAREMKKMTQKECADVLGVTLRAWQTYEQGVSEPKNEILCKIADMFDVSLDYLLGREEEPEDLMALLDADDETLEKRLMKRWSQMPDSYRKGFLQGIRDVFDIYYQERKQQEEAERSKASTEPPPIKKLVRHEATIGELEDARAAREQADQQAKKNAG